MTIQDAMNAVQSFHDRMRVSAKVPFPTGMIDDRLVKVGQALIDAAQAIANNGSLHDRAQLRAHLLLEELGETLIAFGRGDPIQFLDGMADLLYVLLGTAVTYDLPLAEAFAEVHRSNMTKEKQPDDPHAERVRQKGPNYKSPRIAELYWLHLRLIGSITREVAAEKLGVSIDRVKNVEYSAAYQTGPFRYQLLDLLQTRGRETSVTP